MRKVRWAIAGFIALAALLMKAPVWYLLAHMSSQTGGDGWHRAYLFDVSFKHFSQWWLAGIPLKDTSGWFAFDLGTTGGADVTNQFFNFGFTAGLGAIALFIFLLKRTFSGLGSALWNVRSGPDEAAGTEPLLWGLGVMLAVHIVNWLGISYWDQTYAIWFMQLAAIAGLSEACMRSPEVQMEETAAEREDFSGAETIIET